MNALVEFKQEFDGLAKKGEIPVSNDIPIEKMKSALAVAAQKTPALLAADRSSLWQSVRMCAADGLLPDGREAALVIFKKREKVDNRWVATDIVQYIPMVFGLRKRALKSAEVADIRAYLVYEGEWTTGRFVWLAGDEEKVEHRPIIDGAPGEPERGAVIAGYAVAVMKDGSKIRHLMTVKEIDKRRRASPSQRTYTDGAMKVSEEPLGVWRDWLEEQQLKTLVRAISKKLPLSSDDQRVIQESDHDFDGVVLDQQPKPLTLADKLRAAQAKPAEVETQDTGPAAEDESQDVDDAEVVDPPVYDAKLVFPMEEAFEEGVKAAADGLKEDACPYGANPNYSHWIGGYRGAKQAKDEK